MSQSASAASTSVSKTYFPKDVGARRVERLRHIHRMTHEQQIALIEEARAARTQEQDQRE